MELKEAKQIKFTVNEAIDALVNAARKAGTVIPAYDAGTGSISVDSQSRIITLTITIPGLAGTKIEGSA